jgi:hypothetical protein
MRSLNFISLPVIAAVIILTSCSKEETPAAPAFRDKISYTQATAATPYKSLFTDSKGDTTVDLTAGNDRVNMFKALDAYSKLPNPAGSTAVLDAAVITNMYRNSGSPFTDTYAYLNASSSQLRDKTATSVSNTTAVQEKIESFFTRIAVASQSVSQVAEEGKAGKLGTYLVDENGVEWAQVIAKSLIGAYQLDYIGNILLSESALKANNTMVVSGKNYTALEHIWDEAYANLTLKPVFLGAATETSNGGESFIGSYLWEYNKTGYPLVHPAFVKGRVAIVNNDLAVVKEQAGIIRREMEKAIAAAVVGYLQKVKDNATDNAKRAHAYGEGTGFIYSLRFCKLNGTDAAFSDDVLNDIHFNTTGIWQLTNSQVDAAMNKIRTKFGL